MSEALQDEALESRDRLFMSLAFIEWVLNRVDSSDLFVSPQAFLTGSVCESELEFSDGATGCVVMECMAMFDGIEIRNFWLPVGGTFLAPPVDPREVGG
jgi:hypothetical protein